MRDEEQQRKERQAKLLSAIERKIAYKNIDFMVMYIIHASGNSLRSGRKSNGRWVFRAD